jgi:hypothetical protein
VNLLEEVSKENLRLLLSSFKKDKILGPRGWTIEFFIGFYKSVEAYFLRVIEEVENFGSMPGIFNETLIALILKNIKSDSFDDFKPISLCNCIYKIITKVLVVSIKGVLSRVISSEQFGFLDGRKIHEAISIA